MNYIKIYRQIITRAKNRGKLNCYSETHHIIPKCMGGTRRKINTVILTGREHYLVHKLLVKIFPNNKSLIYALWMMSNGSNKNREIISSRDYETVRILFINSKIGQPSPTKGKTWKRKTPMSEEQRLFLKTVNIGNKYWVGKKHTKESKEKQSKSAKNRKTTEENETKRREGISKNNKGKKLSNKHVLKLKDRKGNKNPNFGNTGELSVVAKKIAQYDLNNTLIKIWASSTEVQNSLGLKPGRIYSIIKRELKILKEYPNYIWDYYTP